MLPKKRKFTAADFDSFIVEPPSQPGDEGTISEEPITSITNSNDESISVQDAGGESLMSEDGTTSNNNNGCEKVDAKPYLPCNNEVQARERDDANNELVGTENEQETVGIDLSKRRHDSRERHSPIQSPPQPFPQYAGPSSAHLPFHTSDCSPRRNSTSNFEKYKSHSFLSVLKQGWQNVSNSGGA